MTNNSASVQFTLIAAAFTNLVATKLQAKQWQKYAIDQMPQNNNKMKYTCFVISTFQHQ